MNTAIWLGAAAGTIYAGVCVCGGALLCRAVARWTPVPLCAAEWLAVRFAFGHLLLGSVWTLVALGGWFDAGLVFVACLAVVGAAITVTAGSIQKAVQTVRIPRRPLSRVEVFVAIGAVLILVRAIYPPTNDDALRAYLLTPRVVAETHRLFFQPYNTFVIWPLLAEMNTAATLLLSNETAATVFDAWVAIAFLAALWALSGRAGLSLVGAGVAGLVMASSSAFVNLVGAGKVDIAGAMYGILAVCFALPGGSVATPWFVGLSLGAAVAVKYSNLLLLPGILAVLRRRGCLSIRALAPIGAAMLIVLAPQLWKNALLTGNPVAPFLGTVFGTADRYWSISLAGDTGAPADFSWVHRVIWPFVLTFGGHTGMLGLVSPLLLGLLPLGVRLGVPDARQKSLVVAAAAILGGWFLVSAWGLLYPRFLFVPLALLGVVAGGLAEVALRTVRLRNAVRVALGACLVMAFFDLRSVVHSVRYGLGAISRADVYERHEMARDWYAIAETLNREGGADRAYLEMPYPYFLKLSVLTQSQTAAERQRALESCQERDRVIAGGRFRWLVQPTEEFRWLVSLRPGCPLPEGFALVNRTRMTVVAREQ